MLLVPFPRFELGCPKASVSKTDVYTVPPEGLVYLITVIKPLNDPYTGHCDFVTLVEVIVAVGVGFEPTRPLSRP